MASDFQVSISMFMLWFCALNISDGQEQPMIESQEKVPIQMYVQPMLLSNLRRKTSLKTETAQDGN